MNSVVNSLIEYIECEMKDYNNEIEGFNTINIPNYLAVLEQHLNEYTELLLDLQRYDWWIHLEHSNKNDYNGYTVRIYFQKAPHEADEWGDCQLDFYYDIEFHDEGVYTGFCECAEGDMGYDARYHCCGYGCDWYKPTFSVEKITHLGASGFSGCEHDLWDYSDKYYGITVEEKKKRENEAKKLRIKEEIKSLQEELKELDKE